MSELFDNERPLEATGTSGASGLGATRAGERSDAQPSLGDRSSRSRDLGSQNAPTGDQAGDGPVDSTTGSAQMAPQEPAGRDDRALAPNGVTAPAATDALVSNGDSFRSRWSSVQVGFVDDPGRAVEEAEQLVTDVINDLVEGFRQNRQQFDGDQDPTTDEMRIAFQRYRDFFDRLLNV